LKSYWQVGLWNPFLGEYDGLGELPFNAQTYLSITEQLFWAQMPGYYSSADEIPENLTGLPNELLHMVAYPQLSPDELVAMHKRNAAEVLFNPSIWQNTLREALTADVVMSLIQAKKDSTTPDEVQQILLSRKLPYVIPPTGEQLPSDNNIELTPEDLAALHNIKVDDSADVTDAIVALEKALEEAGMSFDSGSMAQPQSSTYNPNIPFSDEAKRIIRALGFLSEDDEDEDHYFTRERYDKYNGYNDWPYDAIDGAFDGDPDATWNVD
jgi:hypothetical protein